jgi:hypothetical protein
MFAESTARRQPEELKANALAMTIEFSRARVAAENSF